MAKSNAQVALETATEIASAGAKSDHGGIGWLSREDVLRTADVFYRWLEQKQ